MEKEDQVISLDKMFSKGFLKDKGKNKTADFFADDLWNIRIRNRGITPRLGTDLIFDGDDPHEIQGIVSNNSSRLYVVQDEHLREIDYTADPVTDSDLGDMNAVGRVRFITYGIYTIILTEGQLPWLYDGTSLTHLTNTYVPTGTNPTFGTRFAGFTVINNAAKPNTILISRPITTANQEYCYDYVHTDAETLSFDSTVWGLLGTLNNLWVFTEKTIEYMGRNNLSNVGGIASLYTLPLGAGYQLASPDAVCGGGDVLFFMTRNKKIGTINYKATVAEPQIAIISDVAGNSIDGFMQDNLADDQSDAVAAFDRKQNIVKFYVKSRNSTVNDVCIIYDIQNETWLKDDNKYVSCVTTMDDELYSGSAFSYRVLQEETGDSDAGQWINVYFETTDIVVWSPADVKQFRGMQLAGQINNQTIINMQILVDENPVFDKSINGAQIATTTLTLGIGWSANGGEPIGGWIANQLDDLIDFEKVVNVWGLRQTGKKIKFVFTASEVAQNWIIDFLSIVIRPRVRPRYKDVL